MNTERTPQTFLEVPGLCSSIMKIPVTSTSKAAEMASTEPEAAAIASVLAGEIYGLKVQFANIEDNPHNATRFFIIGRQSSEPTGDDKTSLMFTTEHEAGALVRVLCSGLVCPVPGPLWSSPNRPSLACSVLAAPLDC